MLESPRVKIIIDTLQSNGEYDVFSKKYGPIADDAILILNKLRSLPEETFSAPFGQEKLQVLIKGFSQTNQQISKVAEQILNVSDNFQLEKYRIGKIRASNFRGLQYFNGPIFEYDFNSDTHLISGSNGTGKSSILNAIVWLFSDKLLWDRTEPCQAPRISLLEQKDNLDVRVLVKDWPSEVALPNIDLITNKILNYNCWVEVDLHSDSDLKPICVRRELKTSLKSVITGLPSLDPLSIDLSLIMPAKVNHIQFTATNSDIGKVFLNISGLEPLNLIGIYAKEMQSACTKNVNEKSNVLSNFEDKNKIIGQKILNLIPEDLKSEYNTVGTQGDAELRIQQKQEWLASKASERLILLDGVVNIMDKAKINTSNDKLLSKIITAHEAIKQSTPEEWGSFKILIDTYKYYNISEIELFKSNIIETTEKLLMSLDWHNRKQEVRKLELLMQAAKLIPMEIDVLLCPICEQEIDDDNPVKKQLISLKNLDDEATSTLVEIISLSCQRLESNVPKSLLSISSDTIKKSMIADFEMYIGRFLGGELNELKTKVFNKFNAIIDSIDISNLKENDVENKIGEIEKVENGNLLNQYVQMANRYLDKLTTLNWVLTQNKIFLDTIKKQLGYEEIPSSDSVIEILTKCKNIVMSIKPLQETINEMEEYKKTLKEIKSLKDEATLVNRIKSGLKELEKFKDLADDLLANDIISTQSKIKTIYEELYGTNEFPLSLIESTRTGRQIAFKFLVKHRGVLVEAAPLINSSRIRALLWAYIFAMAEIRSEFAQTGWLNFTLLDDPLTSFDEGHRSKFAQKIFGNSHNNQYIVSSHDLDWPRHIKHYGLSPRIHRVRTLGQSRDVISLTEWQNIVEKEHDIWKNDKKDEELARRFVDSVRIWLEEELKDLLIYCPTSPRKDDDLGGLLKKLNEGIQRTEHYKSHLYSELNIEIKKLPRDIHNAHHGGDLRSRIYSDEADIIAKGLKLITALLERCWDDFRSKSLGVAFIGKVSIK